MNEELTQFLKSHGASLVGFADLNEIDAEARDDFPYGISIAVALKPQIIAGIKDGPNQSYYEEYKRANQMLDNLGQMTAQFLKDRGYKARAGPATFEEDKGTLAAKLPHKTVATRAGLGWIGKCALLITRKYGSAVRLTTVLTDAPLETGKSINESLCARCTRCIDACPAKAHTGENWQAGMPRETLYDAFKCHDKTHELSLKSFGEAVAICGLCIVACPWTQDYLKRVLNWHLIGLFPFYSF
ncbi:MAG: epoxyqueuosine reductase [Dehalococcoidales bacterium]|nr:epoxyqueuosine reductase [Dehalococcoidales bacterium]